MIASRDAFVSARFDELSDRFRDEVSPGDYRLNAVLRSLPSTSSLSILDLGCGKGRFAKVLARFGARVIGLDHSQRMLRGASGLPRVRGTARRLPFATGSFHAVIAIEVLQHLDRAGVLEVIAETRRVLRPGGRFLIIDRNRKALDSQRIWLPRVALKAIDEYRGLWMYRPGEAARERWFSARGMRHDLLEFFDGARVEYLLAPDEAGRPLFRRCAAARSMLLWTAEYGGGGA